VAAQTGGVKFDFVFNLSRVMRLIGTINRKATETPDRPHRRSYFVTEPLPVMSQALRHMILNTNFTVPQENIASGTLKCDLSKIDTCQFIQWCRTHPKDVTEPQWFAMITNLARLEGGQKLIHQISALDISRYDYRQTQRVIRRVLDRGYSPTTCKSLIASGFVCNKADRCSVIAPLYLATLHTKYSH